MTQPDLVYVGGVMWLNLISGSFTAALVQGYMVLLSAQQSHVPQH